MKESQLFRFIRPSPLSTLRQNLKSFSSIAVGWGLMAGVAVIFLAERIPNFRQDVFSLLPLERYAEYRVKKEDEKSAE